nr:hypothetical protein [Planctomycetota bacterium]
GGVVGGSAQPFGWATWLDSATTKVPGEYILYGSGCKGTGAIPGGGPIVPKGYDTTYGNSANRFPLATAPMHYMQAHGASDFAGVTPIFGFNFRNRANVAQNAGTIDITLYVGYTNNPATALNTTYASNYAGTPTKVYSGTLNVPAVAAQTDPKVMTLKIPFVAPFIYTPTQGNFVWEAVTTATTIASPNYYDSVSAATVNGSRLYANTSAATTGTLGANYVVCTQLASPGGTGAIVALSNTGLPEINSSFSVDVSSAKASTAAVLWLGATQTSISLGTLAPGCSLYTSYDVVLGVVATNGSGAGALTIGVPNNTTLIGVKFYNQYMVLDAGANTLGLAFSNGGAGKIGG